MGLGLPATPGPRDSLSRAACWSRIASHRDSFEGNGAGTSDPFAGCCECHDLDDGQLLGHIAASQCGSQVVGATTMRLLSSLMALVRLTSTACRPALTARIA